MFNLWDTLRASMTACGPQHLSSARFTQSCGQSLSVIPTTSYPCSSKSAAAAEESTPPLMPTTTRVLLTESATLARIRAWRIRVKVRLVSLLLHPHPEKLASWCIRHSVTRGRRARDVGERSV